MTNFFPYFRPWQFPDYFDPVLPEEFHNYMRTRTKSGNQISECGYLAPPYSNFLYPYQPTDSGACYGNGDVVVIRSAGPFRLLPGEKTFFTEALVYTQDTSIAFSPYDSTLFIQNLKNVRKVKKWYTENNFPSCYVTSITEDNTLQDFELYPNPATEEISIRLKGETSVRIAIYDARGRQCLSLSKSDQFKFLTIPVNQLNNGIYFVSLSWPDGKRAAKKFVVQRN